MSEVEEARCRPRTLTFTCFRCCYCHYILVLLLQQSVNHPVGSLNQSYCDTVSILEHITPVRGWLPKYVVRVREAGLWTEIYIYIYIHKLG